MIKRVGLVGAVVAAIAIFLVHRERPAPAEPPAAPLAPVNPRIPGQDQAAGFVPPAPPSEPLAPRPAPAAVPRVELPRPPPAQYPQGLKALTPPEAPNGPVDKRGGPVTPESKRQMEMVSYAFETLEEDVEECLKQWPGDAPPQEVMLAFEIDKDGLQKSWLEHAGDVPFGPRTCLANAVYGLDWSKIVEQPAMLTQRYTLGRDAGR